MSYTLFVHSHIFRKKGDKVYSPGGLSNDVLTRYADIYGNVIVLARMNEEDTIKNQYSRISNKKVKVIDYRKLTGRQLSAIVCEADRVILRVPCIIACKIYSLAKKTNKTIISEVVGCAFDSLWNHSFTGKVLAPIMYFKTKTIVKNSDGAIYVTKHFLQRRYPTNGISASCSDVNIEKDNNVRKIRNKKIENMDHNLTVGTCGAIDVKYKGQEYVIKALSILRAKGLKTITYNIAGSGNPKRLKKIARKYKVENQVNILGNIPHESIKKYYDNIDIYIQPSNLEGLCRALVEAMNRGCPCIASNVGGNGELIEKEWTFKKGNVKELSEKIYKLYNIDQMTSLSRYNYNKSLEYTKDKLNTKREKFYKLFLEK